MIGFKIIQKAVWSMEEDRPVLRFDVIKFHEGSKSEMFRKTGFLSEDSARRYIEFYTQGIADVEVYSQVSEVVGKGLARDDKTV